MTEVNELNRYHRQQLISGWNQKALTNATVAIVGSDVLAQYVAIPLVALGVGNIRLIDTARATGEGFLDFKLESGSRANSLENKLKRVNSDPNVHIQGVCASLVAEASKYFLEGSNLIIDTTNDPRSKAIASEYAEEKSIPFVTTSCRLNYGKMMLQKRKKGAEYLLHDFAGAEQDEFVSIVLGGLIAEEAKKLIMEDGHLTVPLYYNFTTQNRFDYQQGRQIAPRVLGEFGGKKALLVGAGALGNFAALGLTKLGIGRLDIIDMDLIEDTNLNRQVLYYDVIGELKAEALSEKVKKIGRGLVKSESFVKVFTENSSFDTDYDLILDCVDNFTTRAGISNYAVKHKIPLISGGTSFRAGQVAIYVPGKTACMSCQLNIHEQARKSEERRLMMGCLVTPNPSVIMTNQVIGGIMVNEARTVFNPEKYGESINGKLIYDSDEEYRLGINKIDAVCGCKPKKIAKIANVPPEFETLEEDIDAEVKKQLTRKLVRKKEDNGKND